MATNPSPFLDPGLRSSANSLGILQLKRDHFVPAILSSAADDDYAEGKVENTRFGSFPHSTLIDQPWGSQILASVVDTGSRARKRKRGDQSGEGENDAIAKSKNIKKPIAKAEAASSGFVHLIPPTPETWTLCLPHRTQVVYTPDYSYILQKLRVRPGDRLIEAGAGSGSFTHAAVRAVYNGQDEESLEPSPSDSIATPQTSRRRRGHVYSYEYHAPRATQLKDELDSHGLAPLVTVTNRDVYKDGFCLEDQHGPQADVIFLDLPAPWQALRHLTRSPPSAGVLKSVSADPCPLLMSTDPPSSFRSPLNPKAPIRICTFSPCIEQVTKTVAALRAFGWLEISMSEIRHKRLDVRRERVGLQEEGLRGVNPAAATVEEAVQRLRDVENRARAFHGMQKEKQEQIMRLVEAKKRGDEVGDGKGPAAEKAQLRDRRKKIEGLPPSKHDRLARAKRELENRALYKEGRLVHRTEAELKTHTSYLVFAVLPREWSKEDEEKAARRWAK